MIEDNTTDKLKKVLDDTNKLAELHTNNSIKLTSLVEFISTMKETDYDNSVECKILYTYILIGSIVNVTEYINELGYRIKSNGKTGERKYTSKDISNIINMEYLGDNIKVKELSSMSKVLYTYNSFANRGRLIPLDFKIE